MRSALMSNFWSHDFHSSSVVDVFGKSWIFLSLGSQVFPDKLGGHGRWLYVVREVLWRYVISGSIETLFPFEQIINVMGFFIVIGFIIVI